MFSLKSGNRMLGLLVLVTVLAGPAWAGKRGGSPPPPAPAKPEIAYCDGTGRLWVMDVDGANQTVVFSPRRLGKATAPSWSPDGQHIAFRLGIQVWLVDVAVENGVAVGRNPRLFFDDSPGAYPIPRWSRLGSTIAIGRFGTDQNEIWLIPTQSRILTLENGETFQCPDPLNGGSAITLDDLQRGCGDQAQTIHLRSKKRTHRYRVSAVVGGFGSTCLREPGLLSSGSPHKSERCSEYRKGTQGVGSEAGSDEGEPVIGTVIGHYQLVAKLGEGGMSEVYRARDSRLGRDVALKILHDFLATDPKTWQRFQREARAVAALDHPNIVTVYSFDSEPIDENRKVHFITMQLVEGITLAERIRRGGFTLEEFFDLAIPLADALTTAHDHSVIHRDLKPSNIMISSDGRPRILDFGLAKLRDESLPEEETDSPERLEGERSPEVTEDGYVVGTGYYMSPEQAQSRPLDGRSDLFSMGVIMHEMLTGDKPFTGRNLIAVIRSILRTDPPLVTASRPDLPAALAGIVKRALEKDPSRRFQSAAELHDELSELREEIRAGESKYDTWKRGVLAVTSLGLVAIALSLAGLYLLAPEAPAEAAHAVPLTSMEGDELDPAISPDASRVAFVSSADSGAPLNLSVMLIGSGEPIRLTESPYEEGHPTWSPDGREIAFLRQTGTQHFEVRVTSAAGGDDRLVASVPRTAFPDLDWSPDGRSLVLVSREAADEGEAVFLLEVATGAMRRLTLPDSVGEGDRVPRFSPDGRTVAFVRWFEAERNDVFLVGVGGGEVRKLAEHRGMIRGLDWLPDGSGLIAASRIEGSGGLWKISMDGEMRREYFGENATSVSVGKGRLVYSQQLSRSNIWRLGGPAADELSPPARFIVSTRDDWSPSYSPDGTRIAVASERTGRSQIWLCGSDGEGCNVLETEGLATMPRWSPDSRRIAFSQDVNGNSDTYLFDLENAERPRRLTENPAMDGPSCWSRDGRWIYFFSDRTSEYQVWKIDPANPVPVQVTRHGGLLAQESEDGYLYYLKLTNPPSIWRRPVNREDGRSAEPVFAAEELVMEDVGLGISGFDLWENHLVCALEQEVGRVVIQSLDLETGLARALTQPDSTVRLAKYGRLTVSPDGKWVAYPQLEGPGADLIVLEDFE